MAAYPTQYRLKLTMISSSARVAVMKWALKIGGIIALAILWLLLWEDAAIALLLPTGLPYDPRL